MRAIAGGGRYDNLIKLVSSAKVDLPALGFGMGDVVLADLLQEKKLLPPLQASIDAFVLIEEESLRGESLDLVQRLREARIATEFSLTAARSDKQFKRALELKARVSARVVSKDGALSCHLRDLRAQTQEEVPLAVAVNRVADLLGGAFAGG
jgi:histidyl-tRNA synthetase